jgi:glyoxylase-like metal-dependent hydrolase (beta-lactamase superfamily II)
MPSNPAIDHQLASGAIPNYVSNVCPPGTKMYLLECGWLEADEAFMIRGANTSLQSTADQPFVNKRREMPMYCVLIDHPHEGLILWETGSGKDYPTVWGPQLADVFSRVRYEEKHELDAQIEATGHKVEDVKKIIIGHLHLDHAGGLDLFLDRKDVEIWVHDAELRSAFWSVATGADVGVYLKHYLKLDLYVALFLFPILSVVYLLAGDVTPSLTLDFAGTGRLSTNAASISARASRCTTSQAIRTV